MKKLTAVPSGRRSFSVSEDEQLMMLRAISGMLDVTLDSLSKADLELFGGLHRRLVRVFGFDQTYTVSAASCDGGVELQCRPRSTRAASRLIFSGVDGTRRTVRFDRRPSVGVVA